MSKKSLGAVSILELANMVSSVMRSSHMNEHNGTSAKERLDDAMLTSLYTVSDLR